MPLWQEVIQTPFSSPLQQSSLNVILIPMQDEKYMPIGVQSFEAMITGNYVYVDKSYFIPKMEKLSRAYFLARPRRFGKSLFLSMLQAYFEGRKELFKGLAIEKIKAEKKEEWKKYPVLKLDLNAQEYTKFEHLTTILNYHIDEWSHIYDIECKYENVATAFSYIIRTLYEKFGEKVVVLVDEYDKPLIATLKNEELHEQYRATLKAFYSVIKSSGDYIHMSFLTGVTKFSKVSIFSDLNNLADITLQSEYSTICGITQEELEKYFAFNIEEMAKKDDISYSEMIEKLKKKYDGYHFSEDLIGIYNPFSLCNAFETKKMGDYWFESGTPTFMVRLLEQKFFTIPDLEGNVEMSSKLFEEYRITSENIAPLLFQTGYLTIKTYEERYDNYTLGFPNDEVRYAFLDRLMNVYIKAYDPSSAPFMVGKFVKSMERGDIDQVLTLTKSLIASIPYDSFPEDKQFLREHNYQTAIYLIFHLMGEYVRTEVQSSSGRSDVEVETQDAIYIFEFKLGGKPADAIAQIKEKGYAEKYESSNKNIYLIGVSINRSKRTIGKWHVEKVR